MAVSTGRRGATIVRLEGRKRDQAVNEIDAIIERLRAAYEMDVSSEIAAILLSQVVKLSNGLCRGFTMLDNKEWRYFMRAVAAKTKRPRLTIMLLGELPDLIHVGSLDIQATQVGIAERLGTAPSNISVLFKEWESFGVLERNPKGSLCRWRLNPNVMHRMSAEMAEAEKAAHPIRFRVLSENERPPL